ncbi:MAG TPA: hypothetical protein VD884_19165 [Ohtaekwangia sp.]|nr:hypothetical protein [Ohtaekwangia sp.]
MNVYHLDSKAMDSDFLKGNPVTCKAVFNKSNANEPPIKITDAVLIVLSNGKKYKGHITAVNFFTVDHYSVGEFTVIRTQR